ncbi:uncharacterized protein MELLADRAFT_66006 [Melampsora larici-populina 98AG31]|uniref:F-box domain-containing protein n=1 Tax=Melampsora larici-populina (strain 98AG31 / pathotype 3-4-7) TaxID=747676 RepID=F4RXI5_MELLP|nr:uncharacterized protein MELLADRAFT_66006 [Melampsora larici-populina 98AG31]EGG02970.1 hypothetical protein MELLADRAFT_66006 [Melampsora larici-populina 98AG31]
MLNRLPAEALDPIIERLLELDMAAPGNPIYPHDGRFEAAHSLRALSEVTLGSSQIKPFQEACESFIWRIFRCVLEDCDEMAADPNLDSVARHVRSFTASMRIDTESDASFTQTIEWMGIMDNILNKFSDLNLKHIRLHTHAQLVQGTPSILEDSANLDRLQIAHQQIISSLSNFPSLTALDLENCFALVSEDIVSQCIFQLPNLVRFRAQESALKPDLDLTQGSRLGESLASRTKLEKLSLKNLAYVSPAWCDLNWQGPLTSLNLRGCGNLENQALLRFILSIPSLEKIRLQDHHFRSLDIFTDIHGIPFPNLERFTFLGDSLEHPLFDILAEAPLLEKVHLHSTPVRDCLRGMQRSIEVSHGSWASLRTVIISFIRPDDPERIRLREWGVARDVAVKFHFGITAWNTPELQVFDLSSDEETGNGTAAPNDDQADHASEAESEPSDHSEAESEPSDHSEAESEPSDHSEAESEPSDASEAESQPSDASEAEFEPEDDSDVSAPEDWEFVWRPQTL